MTSRSFSLKTIFLLLGDAAMLAFAIFLAPFVRHLGVPEPGILGLYRFAAPFLIGLSLAGFTMFGLYDIRAAKNNPAFYERIMRAFIFNFALTVFLFYLIPEFRLRPLATLVIIFAIQSALLIGWRTVANAAFSRLFKDRVLFYGLSDEAGDLGKFLQENPQLGFIPVGFLAAGGPPSDNSLASSPSRSGRSGGSDAPSAGSALPVFPPEANLAALIRAHDISIITVAHHIERTPALIRSFFTAMPLGTTIIDFPRFSEAVEGKVPVSLINETWFLENLISARRPKYDAAKRILDLALALLLGAVTLLFFPFIAAAILLSTPKDILAYRERRAREGDGIIFFRQERVGKNGRVFQFVKFRSQVLGAERYGSEKESGSPSSEPLASSPSRSGRSGGPDPRAYPVGTFLRKTYLDELPQLWNIMKNEMSFAGPRPERPAFVAELEEKIPFYRVRELVLPGITGWAQINMQNDASVSDAPEKLQYDLYYIKNRTLALDLVIMLKTTLKLVARSGR